MPLDSDMTPGTILIDEDPQRATTHAVNDPDCEWLVVYEAIAGGGDASWAEVKSRFKAVVSHLTALLGPPDETPTRRQGIPAPPPLPSAWVEAAVWRLDQRVLVAALSGSPAKACFIEISQEAR